METHENAQVKVGQLMEIATSVAKNAPEHLTSEDVQKMIGKSKEVAKVVWKAALDFSKKLPQTLAQRIADLNLDYVNSNINEKNFPISERDDKKDYTLKTVHYDKSMSTEAVLKDLKEQGLEAADLVDLLDYGKEYSDEQRQYPIIELGSIWMIPNGDRSVAYLDEDGGRRDLGLHRFDRDWRDGCRFLVRRKKSA